jgi:hypothetical protein
MSVNLAELGDLLSGQLLRPADPEYEQARPCFNCWWNAGPRRSRAARVWATWRGPWPPCLSLVRSRARSG